jgi:hypothetical protein
MDAACCSSIHRSSTWASLFGDGPGNGKFVSARFLSTAARIRKPSSVKVG